MTPFRLAWCNLLEQPRRTVVSLLGVGVAVLLLFMQRGLLNAVDRTATLVYERLDYDLLIASDEYLSMVTPGTLPRDALARSAGAPGVKHVLPLTVLLGQWRDMSAATLANEERPRAQESILILAIDPARLDQLFLESAEVFRTRDDLARAAIHLSRLDTVVLDRRSRPTFGDVATWERVGYNELNGRRVEISGTLEIGTGFAFNGLLLTSEATLTRVVGWPADRVSLGLVKLDAADAVAVATAKEALSRRLADEHVTVYTRAEIEEKEKGYWQKSTAVGVFFTVGVYIALFVGGVFVYQMMAADIARRLAEYATIRALGYEGWFLTAVVFWQGLLLAVVGFVPGLGCSLLLYAGMRENTGIPIYMTAGRIGLVLFLAVLMCLGAAWVAARGVHRANPADLF